MSDIPEDGLEVPGTTPNRTIYPQRSLNVVLCSTNDGWSDPGTLTQQGQPM